jgi:hypothetical protein
MEPACGCPRLNEADWQARKHVWGPRAFYRTRHGLLFHMPIGIAGAIRKGMDAIKAKGYTIEESCMMLDDETGLFSADMLIALKETPDGDPNVVVWEGATMYSRYYHGPFRGLKREVEELIRFFESQEKRKPAKIYSWVADCPRCWPERGGPTTVLFARV